MICYKDMTFCPFSKDCGLAKDCHRALTQQVLDDAEIWWKGFNNSDHGAPISQFSEQPDCHMPKIINFN